MVAQSLCLSSLALLAGGVFGARLAKRRGHPTQTKVVGGVPVLNYYSAQVGSSLRQLDGEEEWIVLVKRGVTDGQIEEMCQTARNGCKLTGNPSLGGVPFFEMRGTEEDLEAVIARGPWVESIELDQEVFAVPAEATDSAEASPWGLERVGAYQRNSQGAGVTVFVFDTGVRTTHRDFGSRATSALDLTSGRLVECNGALSCAADNQGHGTHCAGSAAGLTYGVAPAAAVRGVKVLGDSGGGSYSWTASALNWVATSRIRPVVASLSLGGPGVVSSMKTAVDAAVAAGVTVVVAAGNSNDDACNYSPAYVPSAITVGATTSLDRKWSASNYGRCTDFWAPGATILSAGHRGDTATHTDSGTSMACPHVSGGAALVLQRNPSFSPSKVLEALYSNGLNNTITGLRADDTNKFLYVARL